MNIKHIRAVRFLSLLLAVLIWMPILVSCKKEKAPVGEPVLKIDEKGKMIFSLLLDAQTLQAHAGQTAYLYELLPGETIYEINNKPSMRRSKVSSKIKFEFDVTDEEGTDRRCNSYLLAFSDGTVFSNPITLSNPESLANNTEAFPRANTIKGLNAYDEDLASTLHSAHTLIPLSTDEIFAGDTSAAWNGTNISLNGALLDQTDAKVLAAARAEMQISLELTVDSEAPVSNVSALINFLLDRYSEEKTGVVTALILKEAGIADATADTYGASVERMAALMRIAKIAMVSRVKNGQVYLGVDSTLEATKAYAKAVYGFAKEAQPISFGVALYPSPLTESLMQKDQTKEDDAGDRDLLLSDVVETVKFLKENMGRSTNFAVLGLSIPASDLDRQSALYAYAYRVAMNARADLLIYSTLVGEESGLYSSDGVARPVVECFSLVDTDSNFLAEAEAADLLREEWTSLKSVRAVRIGVEDHANVGVIHKTTERLVEFKDGGDQGFVAFGRATAPTVTQSENWQTQILATTVSEPYYGESSGLRWKLTGAKSLKDAHVISANLLVQSATQEGAKVFLKLEGTSQDGKALSLTSDVNVSCDTWQSVSFHVRSFTVQMDPDEPCTVTLTVKQTEELSEGTQEVSHTLFLHSLNVSTAEKDHTVLLLIGMIVGGFGIGVSVILLASRKKRKGGRNDR